MAKGQDLKAAAETLQRVARQYEGLVAAAAVLDEIGTLEGRAEESERRLATAKEQIVFAEKRVADESDKAEKVEADAKALLDQSLKDAEGIVDQARGEANDVKAKAAAEAEKMGAGIIAGAERNAQEHQRLAREADTARNAALNEQAIAENATDAARKELADLQLKINAAKEKIAGFVS